MPFEQVVNSYPEMNKPLSAKYMKSFAYPTFKKRIPDILQRVIDESLNTKEIASKYEEDAVQEVDSIVLKIETLKTEMATDHPLVELNADSNFAQLVSIYNKEIQQRRQENSGNPPTWFQTDWLFAECYNYFKLHEIFYTSLWFTKFDPFLKMKTDTLLASKAAVQHLSQFMIECEARGAFAKEEQREIFAYLSKCSLWANKADLSLSEGKVIATKEDIHSEIDAMDKKILVNDLDQVFELLNTKQDHIIDLVLDNAGYELFNDLCFADYLVQAGFAKKVIFHGKAIPWFVSDATPVDFTVIFEVLLNQCESEHTRTLVHVWSKYLENDKWEFRSESFWITPYAYSKMSTLDPIQYEQLSQNKLVIFKGDLNYRKLTGDIYWEPTTSFRTALRGFEPTNVLSLRTIKSDTIAGLKKGMFEEISEKDPNWLITGEYAVIQLLKKEQ